MPGPDDQHMTWDRFKELGHRLFPGPVAPDQLPERAAFEEQLAGLSQRYDHLKAEQDADDPLEPGMSTSAQLRKALAAAEHERDTAYDVVEGIERMRSTAMRERDEALDTLDHVSTLLAQAVKDRDRYRSNFAATLLQFDHLAAVAQALVQTVELWCDLGTPKNRQPIHEPWQKVRDVLASDADDYMRMVLTDNAKRYLEETDSSTTEAGSVPRVAREDAMRILLDSFEGEGYSFPATIRIVNAGHSNETDNTISVIMRLNTRLDGNHDESASVKSLSPKTSNVSDAWESLGASPARIGYETAIATLRGVEERTGSPAARWAADYLAADPDKLAPGATAPKRPCFWCSSPTEACRIHPPECSTCGAALFWYEDDPTRQTRYWRHVDLPAFFKFGAHPSTPVIDQRGPDIGSQPTEAREGR